MKLIALDTETFEIQKGAVAPKLVCLSYATREPGGPIEADVLSNGSLDKLHAFFSKVINSPDLTIFGANIAYDMAVLCASEPQHITRVFELYDDGRIIDIGLRQKTRDLGHDGNIETRRYNLNDVGLRHGRPDRSHLKKDENAWRKRFKELDGKRIEDYPVEAVRYALDDSVEALLIAESQNDKDYPLGPAAFHSGAGFGLFLQTCRGVFTDPDRVRELEQNIEKKLDPKILDPLYQAGLLTPAQPGRPKKTGAGLTKPKPEKKNTKNIRQYVEKVCIEAGEASARTDPSKTYPLGQVSIGADTLSKIEHLDPLLGLLHEREKVVKLKTTYLPNLREGIVYANYNDLVSTGRSSSTKSDLFPSMNMQNQPREDGPLSVRNCFVARPGYVLCSADYSGLELCSLAQKTYELFGYSVHRDKINAGYDLHAYLGAQICYKWDPAFRDSVLTSGDPESIDADYIYRRFLLLAETDPGKYKHFRTFAKPTGLGYPGGLGPDTFVNFARTAYKVIVTREQAVELRDMWFKTYPEMTDYFAWVSLQTDPRNVEKYRYTSPIGMVRAGASYCAAANGYALQTPSAEGAKAAVFQAARAAYDASLGSPFYGSRPVLFIHDEIVAEIPDQDRHARQAAVEALKNIMEKTMMSWLPDVIVTVEPVLMYRWMKKAKPVIAEDGILEPYLEKAA